MARVINHDFGLDDRVRANQAEQLRRIADALDTGGVDVTAVIEITINQGEKAGQVIEVTLSE